MNWWIRFLMSRTVYYSLHSSDLTKLVPATMSLSLKFLTKSYWEIWDYGSGWFSQTTSRQCCPSFVVLICHSSVYARTTDAQWSLFSSKSQTFGLGQTIWADKFWGIWGIFGRFISTHFCTVSPLSMFSINQPLFLQKN